MKRNKMRSSIIPGNALAVKVLGNRDKDIAYALRLWKKNIKEAGIINQVKENMEYEKPTTKRRRLKNNAIRNNKKN